MKPFSQNPFLKKPPFEKGFTLIEFLIALVIIGFIVAILVGVFSSPLKQAKLDSAISQVKDGLRQRLEAGMTLYIQGRCSDANSCITTDEQVARGVLTAAPAVPAGIDGSSAAFWDFIDARPGGCGASTVGLPVYTDPILNDVSEEFCIAYNVSMGLAAAVVDNCSVADCTVAGSVNTNEFPAVAAPSFCFNFAGVYSVVMHGSLDVSPANDGGGC